MKKPLILFAEDDTNLAFVIKDSLELAGFELVHASDGHLARQCFLEQTFDLCLLDVMMPKLDGFTLAKQIRLVNENIPLIFLTAKSLKEDRLLGFEYGADDYIIKPFSVEELILRIRAILKRVSIVNPVINQPIPIGSFTFDPNNLSLLFNHQVRKLTQRETEILQMLVTSKNQLVKREEILIKIWGNDDYFLGRSLDVFISRLRKYLADDPSVEIINHHAVGFRLLIRS